MEEFKRRWKLTEEGVVLVKNKINFRVLIVEPKFDKSLSWLKEDNNDDRIIAIFIEVMKQYPNSYVSLVIADINLQRKAEIARLPIIEPFERIL